MRKVCILSVLFLPLQVLAQGNLVFNPEFDETPWDTGWIWHTDTSIYEGGGGASASAEASVGPDSGLSLPNCCHLSVVAQAVPGTSQEHATGVSEAEIIQSFNPITSCMLKVYVKCSCFHSSHGVAESFICLHINDEWDTVWSTYNTAAWVEVCTTVIGDTIDGIRFYAITRAWTISSLGGAAIGNFFIDDVYIGEVGVEEAGGRLQVAGCRLKAYPNPFTRFTVISYQLPVISEVSIRIYDILGREVKNLVDKNLTAGYYTNTWNGTDKEGELVPSGIYFYTLSVEGEESKVVETRKLLLLKSEGK